VHLTSFLQDRRLTVALTGEIDHHCAKDFISVIVTKIEAYTPEECILDFRDVTFMDSSGVAVVINGLRAMNGLQGKLTLTEVGEQPMKVFRTAGIQKLVQIKECVR